MLRENKRLWFFVSIIKDSHYKVSFVFLTDDQQLLKQQQPVSMNLAVRSFRFLFGIDWKYLYTFTAQPSNFN